MRTALSLLLLITLPLAAQDRKKPDAKDAPKLLYPVPLAVAPGSKDKVILRGLKLDGVTDIRASDPNARVKLLGKPRSAKGPNNYPPERCGDAELEVELVLPKDFPPGALALTASGPKGASEPLKLTVDASPRTAEKEPNDGFAAAQELALPATVDGTIGREKDVDVFRFTAKAGERVRFEVRAARLGSPVDAALTLYDAGRRMIDSCDDADGSADPVLEVALPRDGVYFLSVTDAHDAGGPMFPYRLLAAKGR